MKKRITVISLLLFATFVFFSGCSGAPASTQGETGISVYYISQSNQDLIAEKADVPDTTHKGQVKYLIEQLISPPEDKISPINSGTELNSVIIKDDIAIIDFSKEFTKGDDLTKTLAPAAVAKTLCSLDYISGVQIMVEGKEVSGADGKSLGVIRESDLVISKSEPSSAPKTALVLYFGDENAEFLVPERRNVEIEKGKTIEEVILKELLNGPAEGGNMKTVPSETKVLSIETKDKVCFVNLSKEFVEKFSGGVSAEKLTVYSIVNSLTELGTVDKVQFLIEGKKREEFVHMVFNEPIFPDKTLIKQ